MDELTVVLVLLAVGMTILLAVAPRKSRRDLGMLGFLLAVVAVCSVLIDGSVTDDQRMLLLAPTLLSLGFGALRMLEGLKQ